MGSFLILLGYMGCGKSELGKKISVSRSISFIDLDHFIEEKEKAAFLRFLENMANCISERKNASI